MNTFRLFLPLLFLFSSLSQSQQVKDEYCALRSLVGQERYEEAMAQCMELIRRYPDYLYFYETLPEVALYARKSDAAITFFEERVEDGTRLQNAYFGMGTTYYNMRDYRSAVVCFNNAVEAGNSAPECYRLYEYAYEKLEGLDAAISYFNLLCRRDPANPNHWYGLALAYWSKQDLRRVAACLEEALAKSPTERRYLQAKAAILNLKGKYDEATAMTDSLLKRAECELDFVGRFFLKSYIVLKYFERDHYETALIIIGDVIDTGKRYGFLRWLGWGHKRVSDIQTFMGTYQAAQQHLDVASWTAKRTEDDELLVACLAAKFEICCETGQYYDALEAAYERNSISQERGLSRVYIRSLSDIAWILHGLGSDDTALEYAAEALNRAESYGADADLLYNIHVNIGLIYEGIGCYEEALKNFHQATELTPRDNFWPWATAIQHNRLGRVLLKLKRYKEAEQHLRRQLELARTHYYEKEESSAEAYLGLLYLETGRHAAAKRYLRTSFEKASRLRQIPDVLVCARGLSTLSERSGFKNEALIWRGRAIESAETMGLWKARLPGTGGSSRELVEDYHDYIRVLCQLGRSSEAFEMSEKAKAMALAGLVTLPTVPNAQVGPDSLRNRLFALRKEILGLHSKLASEVEPPVPRKSTESSLKFLSDLNLLEMRYQVLLDSMKRKNDRVSDLLRPPSLPLSTLQGTLLQQGSAILEYNVGEHSTFAFVVTRSSVASYEIKVTRDSLASLLNHSGKVFSDIYKKGNIFNAALANFNTEKLHTVYGLLVEPALSLLKGTQQLTIVPDDVLRNLPFEILVSAAGYKEDSAHVPRRRYLLEDYEISYSYSASTRLASTESRMRAPRTILALGNSVVFPAPAGMGKVAQNGLRPEREKLSPRIYPGVQQELMHIQKLFGNGADILSKSDASREKFLSIAQDYRVIHIAAHVTFDDLRPLYSAIHLTQDLGDDQPQPLRALDILSLRLKADLVVLSGCNTARLGRNQGFEGLTSAIMLAGVPSVVATMWGVDDEATAEFMESFYHHLQSRVSTSKALQLAKIDMIQNGKADPFYWGAFVLLGDRRTLDLSENPVANAQSHWVVLTFVLIGLNAVGVYRDYRKSGIVKG